MFAGSMRRVVGLLLPTLLGVALWFVSPHSAQAQARPYAGHHAVPEPVSSGPGPENAVPDPAGEFGRITGRIAGRGVVATGTGMAKPAEISIAGLPEKVLSDSSGGFESPPLPPGGYSVVVVLPGFDAVVLEDVLVEEGRSTRLFVVLVPRSAGPGTPPGPDAHVTAERSIPRREVFRPVPREVSRQTVPQVPQEPGRIAGRIVDAESGAPLAAADWVVAETGTRGLSDPSGLYRTPPLPPGSYTLQVGRLGYAQVVHEAVVVQPGAITMLNVALPIQAMELEGITVEATRTQNTSTSAGLLAMQKGAAAVSDGVSAEQIGRSPDSNAGDALTRVTGVSIVDGKYAVVRGLGERYSNTLLNGVELPSPEPTKRVVPLDVFPASLLESVVTAKAATPDLPGDFAGGSVQINTKEFPEEKVLEIKMSIGHNSLATGKRFAFLPRTGWDYLGFDGSHRTPKTNPAATEAFAESLRNVWTPAPRMAPPNSGFGIHYGNQFGEFDRALGLVLSFDYNSGYTHQPDRYFLFTTDPVLGVPVLEARSTVSSTSVSWGLVAGASVRLGALNTLSFRNLLTKEAEEFLQFRIGNDPEVASYLPENHTYQVRYTQRTISQTQLGGRHILAFLPGALGESTVDWKATVALATRDEPENRSLSYLREDTPGSVFSIGQASDNYFWFRYMDEWSQAGQLSWTLPLSLRRQSDLTLKAGGMWRRKDRVFDAFALGLRGKNPAPEPDIKRLPPEELFTPENLGRNLELDNTGIGQLAYKADDRVTAAFLMVDMTPVRKLRITGGARLEEWDLKMSTEYKDTTRVEPDILFSGHLTYSLSDAMNLRLAAYQTVARPDPREVTASQYRPVTGECSITGSPDLERTQILNYDVRWEIFPAPGEMISLSGFFKYFRNPIFELVAYKSFSCEVYPANAESATNYGGEVEIRKSLGVLGPAFEQFFVTGNFTWVEGGVTGGGVSSLVGEGTSLPLQDQSRFLVNTSIMWDLPNRGFSTSLYYNYFADRVRRYGTAYGREGVTIKTPDVRELGRHTLDLKASMTLWGGLGVSLSARNVLDSKVEMGQPTLERGLILTGREPIGRSLSMSLSYSFR